MEWIRLYTDILDDEKISKISDFSYKIFTFLLLLCRERESEGIIDMSVKDLSWRFRLPENKIKKAIEQLQAMGILSSNLPLKITKWSSRQFRSDDAAERKRAQRERDRSRDRSQPCPVLETETETETEYICSNDKTASTPSTPSNGNGKMFNEFYSSYPRKVGKLKASQAFKKINPTTELFEKIMKSVTYYKSSHEWEKDGGQFIPHPATFLNQRRFEDDVGEGEEKQKCELLPCSQCGDVVLEVEIINGLCQICRKGVEDGKNI